MTPGRHHDPADSEPDIAQISILRNDSGPAAAHQEHSADQAANDESTDVDTVAVEPTDDSTDGETLVLTTVAVPYGNRLTTYDAAGSGVIWLVPATLTARVAGGTLPRREAGEGASAQCLVVDEKRMLLRGLEQDQWPVSVLDGGALPVPMAEYRERIRQLLVLAARRGESVVFSRPGLLEMEPPCVRSSVIRGEEGGWMSVVEAFPAVTSDAWVDADQDGDVSRKAAAADEEDMMGAAMLMLMASQTFAPGPEQIGLFFEVSADGPWPAADVPDIGPLPAS
ncbi:MAG: hypothetical protein M3Z00_12620 [Actinomycetota bacterium]|nr:hypothetical protein [Actinomycetota bacterium]